MDTSLKTSSLFKSFDSKGYDICT